METVLHQQQTLNFRAVTISDMNTIVKLYQQENRTVNSTLNHHFGLPFYVAELDSKIVGYSYATSTTENDYSINTTINVTFSKHSIEESFIRESQLFFKKEWQKGNYKNLFVSIFHLVNWLNNSN